MIRRRSAPTRTVTLAPGRNGVPGASSTSTSRVPLAASIAGEARTTVARATAPSCPTTSARAPGVSPARALDVPDGGLVGVVELRQRDLLIRVLELRQQLPLLDRHAEVDEHRFDDARAAGVHEGVVLHVELSGQR